MGVRYPPVQDRYSLHDGDFANTEAICQCRRSTADTPEAAANLRLRTELMGKIAALVDENRWTQSDAARRSRVTQARMNDLLRGRISRFSLGALTNIAASLCVWFAYECGIQWC